jgi:hypothetical protein
MSFEGTVPILSIVWVAKTQTLLSKNGLKEGTSPGGFAFDFVLAVNHLREQPLLIVTQTVAQSVRKFFVNKDYSSEYL